MSTFVCLRAERHGGAWSEKLEDYLVLNTNECLLCLGNLFRLNPVVDKHYLKK